MANATKLPTFGTDITFFQWSIPTAPNPRLASPIDDDDTTLKFTSAPLDADGTVVTEAFLMGVKNNDSYVETIYVPAGELSGDGLTATNVIRGIDLEGLDWTTANSSNAASHEQDSPIFCNITGVMEALKFSTLQGTTATGGTGFIIGNDALGQVTISRSTGTGTNVGWLRWNSTGTEVEFSDDGAAWTAINDVVSSDLVKVSATDTTPGYLNNKITTGTSMTTTVVGGGGDEDLRLDTAYTATKTEIDQALSGISATVTQANLDTLTDGSNADALHTHLSQTKEFTAGESISAGDPVVLLPYEIQFYSQLVEADIDLGDANARRRYGVKFTPLVAVTGMEDILLRLKKVAAGQDVTVRIETDTAGDPSGALVDANATATVTAASLTTSYANSTATWAGAFNLVADTDYWIVLQVPSTDAVNYIQIGVNSNDDEEYFAFERKTYDLDLATWGGSVTNATPFFWPDTTKGLMGMALGATDSNFGNRTWSFVGFSKDTGVRTDSLSIYTNGEVAEGLSGLDSGRDYYLDGTGGMTDTPAPSRFGSGSFSYKIGRALSATELQIDTGEKYVWGTITDTATNTTQIKTWFNPKVLEVDGYTQNTSIGATEISTTGVYDGSSNYCSIRSVNHVGSFSTGVGTTTSFGNAIGFSGVGSAESDAGLTYTTTKNGAANDFALTWKAKA